MFYIGDHKSVSLYESNGKCLQRIGTEVNGSGMNQFNYVYGICLCNEELYVSDAGNRRVQVFQLSST